MGGKHLGLQMKLEAETPDISALSISSMSDYHVFDFPGKDSQKEQVVDILDQLGFIPDDLIEQEVSWFYTSLGIDDLFFANETPELLANIIHSLYASKLDAFAKSNLITKKAESLDRNGVFFASIDSKVNNTNSVSGDDIQINIKNEILTNNNTHGIFIESNNLTYSVGNNININEGPKSNNPHELDSKVDDIFLNNKTNGSFRAVSYWTPISGLKLTFVDKIKFDHKQNIQITEKDLLNGNIDSISDKTMIQVSSPENKKLYGYLIDQVTKREGPVIKYFQSQENCEETRLLIAYKRFTTKKYYSAINSLFHYYKLSPSKFFVESFKLTENMNDEIIIFSVYFNAKLQKLNTVDFNLSIKQIEREASLLYAIPNTSFKKLYLERQFSPQEAVYAHVASTFINRFINRLGTDYQQLISQLNIREDDTILLEVVNNLKKKLRTETFSQQMINTILEKYYKIVSKLYKNFAEIHYYNNNANSEKNSFEINPNGNSNLEKTLSYQRFEKLEPFKNEQEFESYLNKFIPNDVPALLILKTLNIFNKSILKTNFFVSRKVAISFRLDPTLILPRLEYPETPYGVFYVIGNTFKGFHIRFRDIARGGIRIVTSTNQDAYENNLRSVIDENYNLAATQQRKNKDIPEGGSKGVILLNQGLTSKDQTFIAFSQYVDAMIDILISDPMKEKYVDLLGHEEILFFGPDEGSATFVDWATNHAKARGCPWWKSFLTGKSQTLGGIPHDEFGMTSLGVRAYVNKLYETLNLKNRKINKFQTGGPDGDLGSNEILLSTDNENYVAIVDGSGVLCDPNGLNKEELIRLATERKMIVEYDFEKLTKTGFFVSINDMDVMLPNGTIVANGTTLRNTFHTQIFKFVKNIDLFVPCGGRPSSINLNNLHFFIDEKSGKSKIPYIVEGANLFIDKAAGLALEHHGCILFKDMSVNKGGVTSSSMEVLASLSLSDKDFVEKFVANENGVTKLYKDYVEEVKEKIVENAEKEFTLIWNMKKNLKMCSIVASDTISQTINRLNDDLMGSNELWENDIQLKNYLLMDKIIPQLITDVASKEEILKNIPVSYSRALLSSYLSSCFVYKTGTDVNIGKFMEFIGTLKREAGKVYGTQ